MIARLIRYPSRLKVVRYYKYFGEDIPSVGGVTVISAVKHDPTFGSPESVNSKIGSLPSLKRTNSIETNIFFLKFIKYSLFHSQILDLFFWKKFFI